MATANCQRRRKNEITSASEKPLRVEVDPDGIPPSIRGERRFVCWVWERRQNTKGAWKWTKPPKNPRTGEPAESDNPETWGTLDEAMARHQSGQADGIGFVLGDGWAGVDLDDCLHLEAGDVDGWAFDIVQRLNTFTDYSPSNTGIKMLCRGVLPRNRDFGGKEFYSAGKYFTLTGRQPEGSPVEAEDRQEMLLELYNEADAEHAAKKKTKTKVPGTGKSNGTPAHLADEEIIRLALRINGEKFKRLHDGSYEGYPSPSEADEAYCCYLAWYTKDPEQIDGIFRDSSRMRDKWEDRADYRQNTIGKALNLVTGSYSPEAHNGSCPDGQSFAPGAKDVSAYTGADWPAPPDAEAYYGLAGDIVRTVEPATEADPIAILTQFLVGFGNMLGRTAHFRAEADTHHLNEYLVLVGQTAKGRKGVSWGQARQFMNADSAWIGERVQSGASSAEGIIWHVRDPVFTREKVKEGKGPVQYVEVQSDPGVEDKRLLLFEPEYASLMKQAERQGNTLTALLRIAWERPDLQALTKNTKAKATGAHISIIGHITADELRRYLTVTEQANGFGNRHLFVCVKRSKVLPEGGHVPSEVVTGLQERVQQALEFGRSCGTIRRDANARAGWAEVYEELSEGKPGMAGAMMGRAEAHVMRLACIYAVLDQSAEVQMPHLAAALAIWEYVERSIAYVFGGNVGDPLADDIHKILKAAGEDGMLRTGIYTALGRHQSADQIGRALGVLMTAKRARFNIEKTPGRQAERWFAL